MTIVDLTKARAYAESISHDPDRMTLHAADWIRELADEVESQQRAVETARRSEQDALADAAHLAAENEQLRAALTDICGQLARLLEGIPA